MKKKFFLAVIFPLVLLAKAQLSPVLWQVKTDTILSWQHYFGEEFSGKTLSEEKWFDHYPWGGLSFREDEYADAQNLVLNNGVLELYAKKTDELRKFPDWMIDTVAMKKFGKKLVDGKYQLRYTGGAIWSKKQFKYGYFECRCKVPSGSGLWPAFWLYGGNPNDEIDFMELKGEKEDQIHVDVHCPDNCDGKRKGPFRIQKDWGGWVQVSGNLTKDWNIISGIWMPGYVTFYVNGDPVGYFEGDFKNSMNLIANIAVAVNGGPFKPGPDEKTSFPAKMEIDYIRVWKPLGDSSFSERTSKVVEADNSVKKEEEGSVKPFLKKPIRSMFSKKKMKNENGFVSLYPAGEKKYHVIINGKTIGPVSISIIDESGKTIKENKFEKRFSLLDLSDLEGKNYFVILKTTSQSCRVQLKL
jgi:beta-glucanase (GH16 family)